MGFPDVPQDELFLIPWTSRSRTLWCERSLVGFWPNKSCLLHSWYDYRCLGMHSLKLTAKLPMKTAMGLKDDSFPFRGKKSLPRKPTTLSHRFEPSVHVGKFVVFSERICGGFHPPLKGRVSYYFLSRCLNSSPRVDFFFTAKMESWVTIQVTN